MELCSRLHLLLLLLLLLINPHRRELRGRAKTKLTGLRPNRRKGPLQHCRAIGLALRRALPRLATVRRGGVRALHSAGPHIEPAAN